jgi:hypothetical protein
MHTNHLITTLTHDDSSSSSKHLHKTSHPCSCASNVIEKQKVPQALHQLYTLAASIAGLALLRED